MTLQTPLQNNQIIISTKVYDTKVQRIEGTNKVIYRGKQYIQDGGEIAYQGGQRIWKHRLTII